MAIILAFILICNAIAYCFQSRRAFNTYVKRGGAHEEGVPVKLHHDSKFQVLSNVLNTLTPSYIYPL